ncbi:hypothetical protein [Clostridium tagluense]|uniref:Uncharacterized protein n=1 Tax=Clostridium tagluense TaxID=360422 RepID=A0A401UJJ2_9CLOT|nr:hypothetical protein [Clostridium tagluense]GCD09730.1 hypothetical protein Ctaglu_13530 [Clostridium tagluense]
MKLMSERYSTYNSFIILILLLGVVPILILMNNLTNNTYYDVEKYINYLIYFQSLVGIMIVCTHSKKLINGFSVKFLIIVLMYILVYYLISYLFENSFISVIFSDGIDFQTMNIKQYYIQFLKATLSTFAIYLLVGLNLIHIVDILNKKGNKAIIVAVYLVYTLFLAATMFATNTTNIFDLLTFTVQHTIYLYIGDAFALYSLIIYSILRNKVANFFVLFNSLFWIYKIGSRASLYSFIIVITLILIKNLFMNINLGKMVSSCAVICLIFIIIFSLQNKTNNNLNGRMLSVVTGISSDESYNLRNSLQKEGIEDIKKHYLIGNMFAEIKRCGYVGDYVHNVLSYWVEFGLVPFICIISMIAYYFYYNFKLFFKIKNSITIQLVFSLSTFIFLEAIISRSYTYPYLWLALSASCSLHYYTKKTANIR